MVTARATESRAGLFGDAATSTICAAGLFACVT
jgi:hypothetical protein